jgi:dTDP-glucose 4,6-dehydratase
LLKAYRDQFDFPVVTVRATNVYGARQLLHKIIPRSILYTKTGRRIPLHGGGVAVKSFIHIRDVSRGELAILQSGQEGQIYHLAPDSGLQVREIVQAVCDRLGTDMGAVVEIVGERPGQDAAYVLDSSKARQEFGWAPLVGFSRGVDEVVQWVEQHWEVLRLAPWDYEHKA